MELVLYFFNHYLRDRIPVSISISIMIAISSIKLNPDSTFANIVTITFNMFDDDECLPFHIKNTLSMGTLHSLPLNLKNHRLQQKLQLLIRRFPA